MIVWFVSRHEGAKVWMQQQGIQVDRWVPHLEVSEIQRGDWVVGTLPVHLAAEVCGRGARYWHLSLSVPEAWRGKELSLEEMQGLDAHVCEIVLKRKRACFP